MAASEVALFVDNERRRLGPEMLVPPKWRDWLERRLAGLGPPQSQVQAAVSSATKVRRSEPDHAREHTRAHMEGRTHSNA